MAQNSDGNKKSFINWITGPEMLVGLSAVLLSVCGLVFSIYETSIMREEQYASVWPCVEIGPSFGGEDVKIWIQNTGVGPAKVRSAAVQYDGIVKEG